MKNFKLCMIFLSIVLCSGSVFAGGQQEADTGGAGAVLQSTEMKKDSPTWLVENTDNHITVIDSYGNHVTIQKPVTSLVSNGMGEVFAALKALKAEEMVAASSDYVTRNAAFFPEISKLPAIGGGRNAVDNEMVIVLSPSLIITSATAITQFSDAVLNEIPALQLNFNSTETYSLLGAVLGKESEAEEFVGWIKSYTDVIDQKIAGLPGEEYRELFIYYGGEYGMSPPPPYGTFGTGSSLRNELVTRAGGMSITRNIPGEWITVDSEWIIEANPSLIIRETYIINDHPELGYGVKGDSDAGTLMKSILHDQPAFEGCEAVKNGEVHLIYGDLVTDSWFISLVYLAKWLHPGLFSDVDAEKMHQEYITLFQRLDYDVMTEGLFTYSAK